LQIEEAEPGTSAFMSLCWRRDVPGGQLAHQLRLFQTQTTVDPREFLWSAVARVVCHVLVDEIPERGLSELYESLNGMHLFYLEQPEQQRDALPLVRQSHATLGRAMERPGFQLESED